MLAKQSDISWTSYKLQALDSQNPGYDLAMSKETFFSAITIQNGSKQLSLKFDHVVTDDLIHHFTIDHQSKSDEVQISSTVEYLVKHMQQMAAFITRKPEAYLPPMNTYQPISKAEKWAIENAPNNHWKLMIVFYKFTDVEMLKEILTVFLSSLKKDSCLPNLNKLGGFIDVVLSKKDNTECQLFIRITDSSKELTQLVKSCKENQDTLANIYTVADQSQSVKHLEPLHQLLKTEITNSNFYYV